MLAAEFLFDHIRTEATESAIFIAQSSQVNPFHATTDQWYDKIKIKRTNNLIVILLVCSFSLSFSLYLSFFLSSNRCLFISTIDSRENNNCESAVNWHSSSATSSEEDNSPTQMNNCRKFIDKAPLVKRLSISLLRSAEQYRPLINNFGNFSTASSSSSASASSASTATTNVTTKSTSTTNNYLTASTTHIPNATTGASYANETTICYGDTDEIISSKFGDSCRKSLTSVLDNRRKDYCEFDLKRNFLRETSSGKIFLSNKFTFCTIISTRTAMCLFCSVLFSIRNNIVSFFSFLFFFFSASFFF